MDRWHLQLQKDHLNVSLKQSILDVIVSALRSCKMKNLITRKELHTLVGWINFAAGLLMTLRPFLQGLWAAWYNPRGHKHLMWTRQIAHALSWLHAFFIDANPGIERRFYLADFNGHGAKVEVGTDASPWGMGGWMSVDDEIKLVFRTPITPQGEAIFGHKSGDPEGPQI